MCDSPYHACRSRTASSGSDTAGPHVGLHDVRIARHALIVPLGDDLTTRQHGDGVGQVLHHAQVVLDHQHRAIGGGLLDEGGDAADVSWPMPAVGSSSSIISGSRASVVAIS